MVTTQVDLEKLLHKANQHLKKELGAKPEVRPVGDDLDLGDLAVSARQ